MVDFTRALPGSLHIAAEVRATGSGEGRFATKLLSRLPGAAVSDPSGRRTGGVTGWRGGRPGRVLHTPQSAFRAQTRHQNFKILCWPDLLGPRPSPETSQLGSPPLRRHVCCGHPECLRRWLPRHDLARRRSGDHGRERPGSLAWGHTAAATAQGGARRHGQDRQRRWLHLVGGRPAARGRQAVRVRQGHPAADDAVLGGRSRLRGCSERPSEPVRHPQRVRQPGVSRRGPARSAALADPDARHPGRAPHSGVAPENPSMLLPRRHMHGRTRT